MQATTKLWRPGILFLVALNLLLGVSSATQKNPTFTTIDVPGATFTFSTQINPAGEIVGQYCARINPKDEIVGFYGDTGGTLHGFLLRKGSFTSIDFPGAVTTCNFGNNPEGAIVGLYDSADGKTHGFLLSRMQ